MDFEQLYSYTKELNILYVEDDPVLQEQLKSVLIPLFANVDTALNGEDALVQYKVYYKSFNKYYDLVLTDLKMPHMDGFRLISEIDFLYKDQAIIVISAYAELEKLIELIEYGISSFILKPFTKDTLFKVLNKASKGIYIEKEKKKLELEKETLKYKENLFKEKRIALKELIHNIAHQWRQPLSVISMAASGLQLEKQLGLGTPAHHDQMLEDILQTTKKMSDIIEVFENALQIDETITQFNIKKTINSILILLKNKLEIQKITLENSVEDLFINHIEFYFQQIIAHVINNAIEAVSKIPDIQKVIFIEVYKIGTSIEIKITDNGKGICDSIIDRICEPYFTTKHKSQGKGMGLYLSSEYLMQYLKGTIVFSNKEYFYNNIKYKGTEVKVTIPLSVE